MKAPGLIPDQRTPHFGPTQKEIAKALGVSQSTVAFALNPKQRHKLLPETVAKVEAMVAELGYHPKRHARMLRNKRSYTITLLISGGLTLTNYHAPKERLHFIAQKIIERNFQINTIFYEWFAKNESALETFLIDAAPEGVIFLNGYYAPTWERMIHTLCERRIPAINVSGANYGVMDSFSCDMEHGFLEMTRHHIAKGSKRLTLLLPMHEKGYSKPFQITVSARVEGFIRAIAEASGTVPSSPTLKRFRPDNHPPLPTGKSGIVGEIIYPEESPTDFTNVIEVGEYHVKRFHSEGRLPDSLICSNDEIAFGALNSALALGIKVPERLLISGADNSPFSQHSSVRLTTLQQPSEQLANRAADCLMDYISNSSSVFPPTKALSVALPPVLVKRRSTEKTACS